RTPNAYVGGVKRVAGISELLHQWMALDHNWRREHARWSQGHVEGKEPKNPLHAPTAIDAAASGRPMFEYRRLAGAALRDGKFANVVAPGRPWISRTTPEQLHQVLQVDANRRGAVAEGVRGHQLALGERERSDEIAQSASIDCVPIESPHHARQAARGEVVGA